MTINERITQVRKQLDLTQTEFANRIGCSRGVIANIDYNRATPAQLVITSICREFNVSEAWLKDGIGEMFLPSDEDDAVNRIMSGESEFAKNVFRALAKLPPEAWKQFEEFVNQLKNGQ